MSDESAHHISAEGLAALEAELHALETEGRSRRSATSPPRSPGSDWIDLYQVHRLDPHASVAVLAQRLELEFKFRFAGVDYAGDGRVSVQST
jgi:hypothetical protein